MNIVLTQALIKLVQEVTKFIIDENKRRDDVHQER